MIKRSICNQQVRWEMPEIPQNVLRTVPKCSGVAAVENVDAGSRAPVTHVICVQRRTYFQD